MYKNVYDAIITTFELVSIKLNKTGSFKYPTWPGIELTPMKLNEWTIVLSAAVSSVIIIQPAKYLNPSNRNG